MSQKEDPREGAVAEEPNGAALQTPRTRAKRSIFRDPVVRKLGWVSLGLVILYLAGVASLLFLGMLGRNVLPRTITERNVVVAKQAYDSGQPTAQEVLDYVSALVEAGRYSTAQSVIDSTIKTVNQRPNGEITFAQAGLLLAKGEYKNAITAATEAQKIMKSGYASQVRKGGAAGAAAALPAYYSGADLVMARSYERMGDSKQAVAHYDEYLKAAPTDSSVLVARANQRIKLGDTAGAKADFQTALKYIPNYPEALDGLKKMGADR